jgi:hypothetical protein
MTSPRLQYDFRFDPWFERLDRPLGIHPDTTGVTIDDDGLTVTFGPWRIVTPVDNLSSATVTGPFAWPKVIGPPHVSLADGGLTLATNRDVGVCIRFVEPVRGSTPLPIPRHGSVTVTVVDPESLAEAVEAMASAPEQPVADLADDLTLDLHGATASELRERARHLGVPGAAGMRKAELVEALRPHDPIVGGTGERDAATLD